MTADIETIKSPVIQKELRQFGLYKFAGAIMWVLKVTLGLSDERMIATSQPSFGKMILDDILDGGNFGQHADIASWKRNTAIGQNILRLERDLRLCWYYPTEAIGEPFFRIWHWWWRKKHQ